MLAMTLWETGDSYHLTLKPTLQAMQRPCNLHRELDTTAQRSCAAESDVHEVDAYS